MYVPLLRGDDGPCLVTFPVSAWHQLGDLVVQWPRHIFSVTLATRDRSTVITSVEPQRLPSDELRWSDEDVQSTLSRLWGLPDPLDYPERRLWVADCLRVVAANMAAPAITHPTDPEVCEW